MRKVVTWLLIALLALQCVAFAESAASVASTAVNSAEAVRTATDIYFAIPSGDRQMLVRVPLSGGEAICVDRADSFGGMIPYEGGAAYLKTTEGSSAIMRCSGNDVSTVYAFGADEATDLSFYGGKFLVLLDGLLHSVEPGSQVCLKLSGAQMLDYVLGEGCAYFLSAGDRMEYTAQLEAGQTTSTQAGCVYRLDLNSGETTLLLKSGGRDLKLDGNRLYFHNLADAYAVRSADETELLGRVYSLDVQLKTLSGECTEPDSGFWPTEKGLVVWYNAALNLSSEAGTLALYAPENGATVVSDGASLFVWERGKQTLTEVKPSGDVRVAYTGDLAQAKDASLIVPEATPEPSPSATASDTDSQGNSAWFDQFLENKELASGGNSGAGSAPKATPIGQNTPTPRPVATVAPSQGSGSAGSTGSGSSSGSSSSGSGSSSSSGSTPGGSYNVSIDYVKITGNSVNVRSKAGTSGSILGSVVKGTVLSCTGKAAKDSSGMAWYKVNFGGGTGWVASKYAKSTGAPDSSYTGPEVSASGDYIKTEGSVNVRKSPNLNSASLGTATKGTTLTFLGKTSTDARGVKWYKVSFNGSTGWVSSRYTEITYGSSGSSSASGKYVKAVGGSVTIRSSANKSSGSLGYIPEGKTGTYQGKTSTDSRGVKWYKVSYGGVTGWVSSRYAQLTNSASSSSSGSSSSSSGSKVQASGGSVTIRAKANKTSDKLGFMAEGKTATYLGKSSTDSRGVKWYYVSYNGVKGWVSSKYSKLV